MTDNTNESNSFHIVVAEPDWTPTEIVVADAYRTGAHMVIEPREGMCVQDEDALRAAIANGEKRFQAKGYSMREACELPKSAPVDTSTRINAWRYLIVPVPEDR